MRTLPFATALLLAFVLCVQRPPALPVARIASLPIAPVCDPSSADVATYGSALARSADGVHFAAVDEDADAVVILARSHGALTVERRIAVGHRPSQALLSAAALWVVERGDGAVGVYDLADGHRRCHIPLAHDPVTLARTADGSMVLVAATLPPRLFGVDARTGARRFEAVVPREARGLWVSPAGDRVVLSHLAGDPLSAVDLRGDVATPHALPSFGYAKVRDLACAGDFDRCTAFTRFEAPSQAWSITEDPSTRRLLVPMVTSTYRTEGPVFGGAYGGGDAAARTSFALGVFDPVTLTWGPTDDWQRAVDLAQPDAAPVASALAPDGSLVVLSQARDGAVVLRRGVHDDPLVRPSPAAPDAVAVTPDGDVLLHSGVDRAVEYGPSDARVRLRYGDTL